MSWKQCGLMGTVLTMRHGKSDVMISSGLVLSPASSHTESCAAELIRLWTTLLCTWLRGSQLPSLKVVKFSSWKRSITTFTTHNPSCANLSVSET